MGRERRRQTRLDAKLFADFEDDDQNKIGRGVVLDVSLGGVAVETESDLPENGEIRCHIEIPINVRARVVRIVADGQLKRYGLKFVGQTLLDKILLSKLLKGPRHTRKVSS